jgi:GxxExxY protein
MSLSHGSELSERVIGSAIDVHRQLGPGLLEAVYEECLCFELKEARIEYRRQVSLPVFYKGVQLECGYRMDIVVERRLVVEIKAVERFLPIHEAQMLTYLRLSGLAIALLVNFNSVTLKNGLRRFVR